MKIVPNACGQHQQAAEGDNTTWATWMSLEMAHFPLFSGFLSVVGEWWSIDVYVHTPNTAVEYIL